MTQLGPSIKTRQGNLAPFEPLMVNLYISIYYEIGQGRNSMSIIHF